MKITQYVDVIFDWEGTQELSSLQDDLVELKEKGATHIRIVVDSDMPIVDFSALKIRDMTPEEQEKRMYLEDRKIKNQKIEELNRLENLLLKNKDLIEEHELFMLTNNITKKINEHAAL
jgi:hypothetical protein